MLLAGDRVPRLPGHVSVGSRRYTEWQNLVYQATVDVDEEHPEIVEPQEPALDRPLYKTPTAILPRPLERSAKLAELGSGDDEDGDEHDRRTLRKGAPTTEEMRGDSDSSPAGKTHVSIDECTKTQSRMQKGRSMPKIADVNIQLIADLIAEVRFQVITEIKGQIWVQGRNAFNIDLQGLEKIHRC